MGVWLSAHPQEARLVCSVLCGGAQTRTSPVLRLRPSPRGCDGPARSAQLGWLRCVCGSACARSAQAASCRGLARRWACTCARTARWTRARSKIVYVAPMKALVAEMVGNFSERLKEYNMQARGGPCSRALAERVCCALAVGWGGRAVHGLQSLIVC